MTDKHKQDKQCSACLITLPLESFYYSVPKGTYLAKCRECIIEYNSNHRKQGPSRPKKRVSSYVTHRKLISDLGPGIAMFSGRYTHTYKKFSLYLGPWGYILDGELYYGQYDDDDVLYTLHSRHMRLMQRLGADLALETVLENITQVRNSCGVPIEVRFAKSLVSLDQYFLWMDKPRKLLISEAADHLSVDRDILNFCLHQKSTANSILAAPVILKNSEDKEPQVPNNTYEVSEE